MSKKSLILIPIIFLISYLLTAVYSLHQVHKGFYYNDKRIIKKYVEWNDLRKMHENKTRHLIEPGCRNCLHGAKKKGVSNMPSDWDVENMEWDHHPTKV